MFTLKEPASVVVRIFNFGVGLGANPAYGLHPNHRKRAAVATWDDRKAYGYSDVQLLAVFKALKHLLWWRLGWNAMPW